MEAEHALPFVRNYTSGDFPRDRLFVMAEDGEITTYPAGYSQYV
jgi:hypothetical protein